MGGPLPPATICTAVGLMLSFAPRVSWPPALALLAALALGGAFITLPLTWMPAVFSLCWVSVLTTAASVHLKNGPPHILTVALAANGGLWAGLTSVAGGGGWLSVAIALPLALLAFAGAWLVENRMGVGVKVLASWLLAIAILGTALPFAPTLLGYQPDHLE